VGGRGFWEIGWGVSNRENSDTTGSRLDKAPESSTRIRASGAHYVVRLDARLNKKKKGREFVAHGPSVSG
jgi:hypothetical protein